MNRECPEKGRAPLMLFISTPSRGFVGAFQLDLRSFMDTGMRTSGTVRLVTGLLANHETRDGRGKHTSKEADV